MEQQWLGRFIPFISVSATLTPVTRCWCNSTGRAIADVCDGLQVQCLSPAPECECSVVANIPGFQPGDTSSNLVIRSKPSECATLSVRFSCLVTRSRSLVAQLGERLSNMRGCHRFKPCRDYQLWQSSSMDRARWFYLLCCGFESYHSCLMGL